MQLMYKSVSRSKGRGLVASQLSLRRVHLMTGPLDTCTGTSTNLASPPRHAALRWLRAHTGVKLQEKLSSHGRSRRDCSRVRADASACGCTRTRDRLAAPPRSHWSTALVGPGGQSGSMFLLFELWWPRLATGRQAVKHYGPQKHLVPWPSSDMEMPTFPSCIVHGDCTLTQLTLPRRAAQVGR
jgi:hypothetical protein